MERDCAKLKLATALEWPKPLSRHGDPRGSASDIELPARVSFKTLLPGIILLASASRGMLFLLCVPCLLAPSAHGAEPPYSLSHIRLEHRAVLQGWLAHRPNLRVALERDCADRQGLAAMRRERGRKYHPYYAVGDFNDDGREDFAVTLINKSKPSQAFIVVFNDPADRNRSPALISDDFAVSNGGLWVGSADRGQRLIAGPFESDACLVLQPTSKGYRWKGCLDY